MVNTLIINLFFLTSQFGTPSIIISVYLLLQSLLILGVTLINEFWFLKEKCPLINGSTTTTNTAN